MTVSWIAKNAGTEITGGTSSSPGWIVNVDGTTTWVAPPLPGMGGWPRVEPVAALRDVVVDVPVAVDWVAPFAVVVACELEFFDPPQPPISRKVAISTRTFMRRLTPPA